MAERVGGSEFCTLPKFRTPTLSALPRTIGVLPLSLSSSHWPYLFGNEMCFYRCPAPPAVNLRRRFWPFPLPVTSGSTSPATFRGISVASHLRQHISGNVSGRFRCQSPPAAHLRQRFGPFPLPVTSCRTSPATFQGDRRPSHRDSGDDYCSHGYNSDSHNGDAYCGDGYNSDSHNGDSYCIDSHNVDSYCGVLKF